MKLNNYTHLLIVLLLSALFTSCLEDDCAEKRTFVQVKAVMIDLEDIRQDPVTESPRDLENPGKMYFYNDYILVNELKEGIHIINNKDAKNPVNEGFIKIPGNVDIAVKDDFLYADNYIDLLSIDISDLKNTKLSCRIEDVFQSKFSVNEREGVIVDYVQTENTIELDCSDPNFDQPNFSRGGDIFVDVSFDNAAGPTGAAESIGGSTGTGGSLARFTVTKDHLYVIDDFNLFVYDVEQPAKPRSVNKVYVEWGIETLFPYQDLMFIGANNGMFIYDNTNPSNPEFLSKFEHARACDPVFVQGDFAYVTLRDGSVCEAFSNQLDVVDVSDFLNPTLVITHQMQNPHGLSVRSDYLYICEGEHGLKVFDKRDVENIPDNRTDYIKDIHAYDVISLSESHLLVIGKDGLYQYDASDKDNLKEMSVISVTRPNS